MNPTERTRTGSIAAYMKADHDRIADLRLNGPWSEFRVAALRHIALEERILLPAIRRWRGGVPLAEAGRLRDDHTAIATLLLSPPSAAVRAALKHILGPHKKLEEGPGGLYEVCDPLAGEEATVVAERLRLAPSLILRPQGTHMNSHVRRMLAWVAARAA